ncbi:TonB-dependent receptor [Pseudomonas sp. PA27(2017)]|nr:TonB-dependent receptor [Pseudomonas sp. PA27(2017)]
MSLALSLACIQASAADDPRELPLTLINADATSTPYKEKPYAVTAIEGKELQARRQDNLAETLRSTPGVSVYSSGGPNDYNIMIRGVGSLYQMSMDDSSVGMSLDGIDLSTRNLSLGTLDVERVEVLKGVQGTSSSASGAAGLINVITRKPTRETEGYVRAEIAEKGRFLQEGAIGGALSEQLSARIALRNSGEDSWIDNSNSGHPVSEPRDQAVRGSLLWDINESTRALLTAERNDADKRFNNLMLRPYGSAPSLDVPEGLFDDNEKSTERYSLRVEHDFDAMRLTSTTATTKTDFSGLVVYDNRLYEALYGSPSVFWNVDESVERTYSQDFNLASAAGSAIDWQAGLMASRNERSYDTPSNTFGSASAKYRDFTSNRYAAYGEATLPLTESLKLTTGLRHTWERKTYKGEYNAPGSTVTDAHRHNENYSTGRIGLTYALTPHSSIYGLVSHGHKAGGFNDYAGSPADSAAYKAANLDSLEVGFKSETQDAQFALNGALYVTRTRNDHILSYNPNTFATTALNADTRSRGAELEGLWRPQEMLTFKAAVSYIDARITTDAQAPTGAVQSGNRVPDTARWNGTLGVDYRQPLTLGNLPQAAFNARADYQYVGAREADPQNRFDLAAYEDLSLRVGLEIGGSEVYAFADNLLNQRYELYGFYSAGASGDVTYGAPARGRTVGMGYAYRF